MWSCPSGYTHVRNHQPYQERERSQHPAGPQAPFLISAPRLHQQGATVLLLPHLLPVPELRINGIIPNALFCVDCLSVIIVSVRCIHTVAPTSRLPFHCGVVFCLYASTAVRPFFC